MQPASLRRAFTLLAACVAAASSCRAAAADFSIVEHGARGDGTTLNTAAIHRAIDAAAAAPQGGTVVVPAGTFRSGAIFLKARVNLRLEKDAVLLGSANIDDYPLAPTRIEGQTIAWRPALVNADKCDGLQISGEGTIQGGGKPFWDAFLARRAADKSTRNLDVHRPRNLFVRDSNDVVIRGISLRDSGFWNLHLYRCQNVTIDKLDIRSPPGAPSTDGIDIDSCQDATVRDCYISVDDDNIALKGTKGPLADQDAESPPVERVRIVGCTFAHGHGVITLGSEASTVRDVLVEDCTVAGGPEAAHQTTLVRLKLRPDTPQSYENLTFRNIRLDTRGDLIRIEPWTQYFDLKGQLEPSQRVANVRLENITGSVGGFGRIAPPAKAVVRGIVLKDVDVQAKDAKIEIVRVENFTAENAKINGVPLASRKD